MFKMNERTKEILTTLGIIILWFLFMFIFATKATAQVVGKTQTEQYKASFETSVDIDSLLDYD